MEIENNDKSYRLFAMIAKTHAIEYVNHLLLVELRAKMEKIPFAEMLATYNDLLRLTAEKNLRVLLGENDGDIELSQTTIDDLLK